MATGPRYSVPYKRKRMQKTNYGKRLKLVKGEIPRLVVRRSNKNILVQIIKFDINGDKTITSVTSESLKKYGFLKPSKNMPSSYLTGYLIGKVSLQKKIKKCILDIGLNVSTKGNRLYAVAKGAIDAGMEVPCGKEVMPDEKRLKGEHIKGFDTSIIAAVKKSIDEKVK
ncbi:50S ribosomal protein L18 [Candidatus Tiddalikarchaeum anstoanum]|nr:50S ribosomal protein L18 [Candidatus Tiddalikarchaeum anstoanum]